MKDEIRNALRLAREVGGPAQPGDESSRFVQEQLHSGEPQAPQYVPEADFPARASRAVEAVDRTAGAMNDMAARAMYMDSMQSPKGRSAAEIVTAPIPADPNEVSKQAVQQYRGGDRLGAAETMLGGMPQTGALRMGAARPYRDPKSQYIGDWKWRPLEDVQAEVGTTRVPEHVENFGKFMRDMSDKAATERLDPEDAIKAYMITRSSIQREGRTPEKLASYGIPVRQTDEPLVRPEGHMADFLTSPMGTRFLNEARKGELSQDVVEAAQKHMKPFGMSSVEPDAMDWARRNLPERTPIISDLVSKAKSGGSSPSEWRGFTLGVKGIGPAKAGFLGSLLGRGDLPTLDARQAILHTGLKNAEAQKIMQKKSGRAGHEAVDRLAARQRAMNFELPEELQPFYQHLAHHTVWDAIGKERTTHQDIIDAMRPRADGGMIERKEWSPFRGLKIKPPAEKLSDEPDIREYQEKRHAHEFEGAPEPVAPRRPVVLDAPLFGGKKELGTLPYDYQPAVQKALNLIYGQKTLPLYAYPATAPIGRALDAYETAKFIQRDPTDIKNYTGVPGVLHGAGRAAVPAIGAGAGAGIVASDDEPKKRADGGPLPMRFSYGPRYGSTDLKDIGFRGPLKQPDGSVVSEYSSDRDIQYPSVYKGITDRDLATVMAHERMSAPKYRGEDEMSQRLNAAQPRIPFPEEVDDRAYTAARQRVEAGHSPFYEPGHDPYPQWSPDQTWEKPAIMPKSEKPKYAHGGEVADALRVARSRLADGGQPMIMQQLQQPALGQTPGVMGGPSQGPVVNAGRPVGGPQGHGPGPGDMGRPMGPRGRPAPAPGIMGGPSQGPVIDAGRPVVRASGGGAWTRKEGKNPEGGLNEKGRASLRAQGHDIKRPQPEGGPRRDSFCARSAGQMKMFPEAAKDPNSRLRKARRKWNCADGGPIDEAVDLAARKAGGEVWDKPRPKGLGEPKPLSKKAKSSAKARAKAAGRPWPNLIDNIHAARKD